VLQNTGSTAGGSCNTKRKILVIKMPVQQKQELIRHNESKHQTQFGVYLVLNLPGKYLFLVPASQLTALNLAAYAPLQQKCISVVADWKIVFLYGT
jgi:tellurite resistance-related uncharacterized protein